MSSWLCCRPCGKKIPSDGVVCPYCLTPLEPTAAPSPDSHSEDAHKARQLSLMMVPYIREGWRVEHRDYILNTAVVSKDGSNVNHLLHFVMTLLTAGAWAVIVWLPLSVFQRSGKRLLLSPEGPEDAAFLQTGHER